MTREEAEQAGWATGVQDDGSLVARKYVNETVVQFADDDHEHVLDQVSQWETHHEREAN